MGRPKRRKKEQQKDEIMAAVKVVVPDSADIVVIGGGAAGLAAAITAAHAGAKVVVLEMAPRIGRTILATGNGRCNFSNRDLAPEHYNHPDFVQQVMGPNPTDKVLSFFSDLGLAWAEEEGRLYPLSRQAESVRQVLLARAQREGVILASAHRCLSFNWTNDEWHLDFYGLKSASDVEHTSTHTIIYAAGGEVPPEAVPKEVEFIPPTPALCPLACEGLPFKQLNGRRLHAQAQLIRDTKVIDEESGEFLFRSYGLSGIATFNLSRKAQPHDRIVLDAAPAYTQQQVMHLISLAGSSQGVCDPILAEYIDQKARYKTAKAAHLIKHLTMEITGKADTDHAQIHRGGFAVSSFSAETLEATGAPRFYAAGEALDVDGDCGGYNLSWAWLSGIRAGQAGAEAIKKEHPDA